MGKRLTLALVLAVLGAMVCPLPSQAQGGFLLGPGQAVRARPHMPLGVPRQNVSLSGPRRQHYHRGRRGALPYLYPPYYYSDYYSEPAPSETEPSRIVVVERTEPRAEAPPPAPPPESLMLELRGNHWVRVTGSGQTMAESQPGKESSAKSENVRTITPQERAAVEPPRELPPAVLVFRDGHREEITRYTIVGGAIYTSGDYWNSGSWTKKVPIAELDVPATLELNRERGAHFNLPSSPHVVVIRP
ncbi:MAG: hypothetical protein WB819_14255 [Terriglobia bacterium]